MKEEIKPWIPNIVIGKEYDKKYADAWIHYDSLENFASVFGRDMPVHRHSHFLQIHFVKNNEVNFHIDDRYYHVYGPVCFVTPATVPHSFQLATDAKGHVITVHQSLIWALFKEGMPALFELNLKSGFCIVANDLSEEKNKHWLCLEKIFNDFEYEWKNEDPGRGLLIELQIKSLLIYLLRLSPQTNPGAEIVDLDFKIFRRFSDLVEQDFTSHVPLRSYTDSLGVSESKLNQVCQKLCNSSPKKMINERLLQEACRLLVHTTESANEIAYSLGFTDPSYFSRFFKKNTGKTTQSYRENPTI
jgi:AraC family 4-hydroxyphenylacetate 3-monooxygenase operon regulatory protein